MMTGLYFFMLLFFQQPHIGPTTVFQENLGCTKIPSLSNLPNQTKSTLHLKPPSDTTFFEKINDKLTAANGNYYREKVYLQFDRTFFEPGEAIWFSAYVRDANSLKVSKMSDVLYVQLIAPNGTVVQKIELLAKGGQAAGDFLLPASANGGMYKIKAFTNWMKNFDDAFERDIQVQATVLPRLRMELDFEREAYGAGDAVTAKLDLNSLANEPLKNHAFSATASLAGEQFTEVKGQTDNFGKAEIIFDLPKNLVTNDGLLNVRIEWQGQMESISRSVPIVLNKVDLQFLPEGGDLVAGLPARVAFKALNEFGKPADVEGLILNSEEEVVTTFRSYHQGMGAFSLTPEKGETYTARVTKPEGIAEKTDLPKAQKKGFTMQVYPDWSKLIADNPTRQTSSKLKPETIHVQVQSTENESLTLALVQDGEVYFTEKLPAQAGSHSIQIPSIALPIGIAQVTLFDSKDVPCAERLVFLNPQKKLNVKVKADKLKYLPREKVELSLNVTDELGLPVSGQFSLAVADDNLLTFADDKQGHILSHMLLESELKGEVIEPNFYFDPAEKHPEKDQFLALDYLMLTQGWRRFNWENVLNDKPMAMQFASERAVTKGAVVDKMGKPVPRMRVVLDGTDMETLTDAAGRFEFDTMLAQGVVVKVNHLGMDRFAGRTRSAWEEVNIQLPLLAHSYVKRKRTEIELQDGKLFKGTTLQGTITDAETGEHIIFGTVALYKNGILKTGTDTDLDGFYSLTEIDPGTYDVEFSYTGYATQRISDVSIGLEKGKLLNVKLSSGVDLMEVTVVYEAPLIEQDNTSQGAVLNFNNRSTGRPEPRVRKPKQKKQKESAAGPTVFTKEEVKNLPTRSVEGLVALGAGVVSLDEGDDIVIRGSRANATNYYLDGIRVSGSMVPKQNIEQLQVITGGVEARYGDSSEWKDEFASERIVAKRPAISTGRVGLFSGAKYRASAKKAPYNPSQRVRANVRRTFYTPRNFPPPNYNKASKTRTDFRKTIHWQPVVKTGRDGKATVEFYTSDAITTFRVTVEGLGADGSIGRDEERFFTQMPFSLDAKLPVNLLTGDQLLLPITLTNNTAGVLEGGLQVDVPTGFSLVKKWPDFIQLAAGESKTFYPEYNIENNGESGFLKVHFSTQGLGDTYERPVKVQSKGFPVDIVMGGNEQEETFVFEVSDLVEGSLTAGFEVHPTVLTELSSGLERMLRQPGGCFEQTSSGNYPNVLVINFLRETNNANPELEERTNGFLKHGYDRLLGFEINGGGFEWFGQPAAHEGLTAFGLMQFVDMAAVYPVEQDVIDRTAKWLLTRRDGKGGWKNGRQGTHGWQKQSDIADAYITWALTEAGYGAEISREVEKSLKDALQMKDPYLLALSANTLLKLNDERAEKLLSKLADLQKADGSWDGLSNSVTHSTGRNLTVETTALATLAFLQNGDKNHEAEAAIDFISKSKTPYGFGTTQSTVLALKALVAYADAVNHAPADGTVELIVNGNQVEAQNFSANGQETISISGFKSYLAEGRNEVTVRFANAEATLPYDLTVNYSTRQPMSSEACKLGLETQLNNQNSALKTGSTTRLTTTLTNRSTEAVPNPIAIVGIPAGLTVQPWQVKQMQEREVCDFYEIKDSYIVFYFREMEAEAVKKIHLDLKADLPGSYEAPASMAYLYYSNEDVVWSKPERVVVEN